MTKGFQKLLFFVAITAFSVSIAQPSHADKPLTEDIIRSFIQETTRLTSVQDDDFDQETVHAYLERHLHPKARFKSTMRYTIPGHEAQQSAISMNKEDYIDSIAKAPDAVGNYDHEIEIKDIRIAKNGGNATVTTRSVEKGHINVSAEQRIPMEGLSTCNQIIVMGKNDVIQMYSAQCTTEVEFTELGF